MGVRSISTNHFRTSRNNRSKFLNSKYPGPVTQATPNGHNFLLPVIYSLWLVIHPRIMNISTNCGTYFFKSKSYSESLLKTKTRSSPVGMITDHDLLPAAFPVDTCNTIQRAHIRCCKVDTILSSNVLEDHHLVRGLLHVD